MLYSYELNGVKESFADFISNISPQDTYIVSNSKKLTCKSNTFKWQYDSLAGFSYGDPDPIWGNTLFSQAEGAEAKNVWELTSAIPTKEQAGATSIFTKVFHISDTALASSVYGRKDELKHQLELAGKELKNCMEYVFSLNMAGGTDPSTPMTHTHGLGAMIADLDVQNPDAQSLSQKNGDTAVHKAGDINFDNLNAICLALFRNGSKANVILANPFHFKAINEAIKEAESKKVDQLEIVDEFTKDPGVKRQVQVKTFTDSFGYVWEIKYSRYMPREVIYFIDPDSLTQRVLREPKATKLGKQGSFETWQIVCETGLQLDNPYSCGMLDVTPYIVITNQPESTSVSAGSIFSLFVGVDTTDTTNKPTIQWYGPGGAISGATSNSFYRGNVATGDSGDYYAVISSPGAKDVKSDVATVTVT